MVRRKEIHSDRDILEKNIKIILNNKEMWELVHSLGKVA